MIKKTIELANRLHRAISRDREASTGRLDAELAKFNLDKQVMVQTVFPKPDFTILSIVKENGPAIADDDHPLQTAPPAQLISGQRFNFDGYTKVACYLTHDPIPAYPATKTATVEVFKFNPDTQEYFLSQTFAAVDNNEEFVVDVNGAYCYFRLSAIDNTSTSLTLNMAPQ